MIVVTAGSAYLDIDAYAGIIAYAELLQLQGKDAVAVSSSPLNASVVLSVRDNGIDLTSYTPTNKDTFVLIDVTNRAYIDEQAREKDVIEIIDHHPGHEDFWKEKLQEKAQIETVGAACTLVYERWEKSDLLKNMKPSTARMLAAGILDNTLNFTAAISCDRDKNGYNNLLSIAGLDAPFAATYFLEVQKGIETDLSAAIKNDVKLVTETPLLPHALGQLVIWDAGELIGKEKESIDKIMASYGTDWAVNIVSLSEGKTYFMATNQGSQAKLRELFGVTFQDGISDPRAAMLRKEMATEALAQQ